MQLPKNNVFVTYLVGVIYSVLYMAAGALGKPLDQILLDIQFVQGLFLLFMLPFALRLLQQLVADHVIKSLLSAPVLARFYRIELFSWPLLLLPNQLMTGITSSLALTLLLLLVLLSVQAAMLLYVMEPQTRRALLASERYVAVLFLVSGFSALIYQVVWQRVLFTTFGVHSEAVTVIVSVFMFGLGLGALAGGYLQKKYPDHLLGIFIALETLIGLFGLCSLQMIHFVSQKAGDASTLQLVGWTYLILAVPTLLMGATLPVLVAFLQKYFHNLGKTVGLLYAFNTIGSAIAAFCTVAILFVFLGQAATIVVAACCNLVTALLIYDASHRLQAAAATQPIAMPTPDHARGNAPAVTANVHRLPMPFVFLCLMAIGYISLSQEIIWYRLLGFLTAGRPQIFGYLLTAFLVGVAAGSMRSKKICESGQDPYVAIVRALVLAALVFYLATPCVAWLTGLLDKGIGLLVAYILIGLVAYYTGGLLPMLVHLGADQQEENSTMSMSWLYFANIIGSTCGPMLTGFILLDQFSMEGNIVILSVLTLLLLGGVLIYIPKPGGYKLRTVGAMAGAVLAAFAMHGLLYQKHLEKLQYADMDKAAFRFVKQNRAGIITVEKSDTDVVYGGGIYDGRVNANLQIGRNMIGRAYFVASLHRKPRKALEIGLSSGSWAKVLVDYQPIESLSIVEINPGYADLIQHYPEVSPVLHSPKVTMFVDDGRRWLRNHPDEKFDLILMNTTYHWRSNVTNLLSVEFLQMAKAHLNPGGVIYYNTTDSQDVVRTAAEVFKHVSQYMNFVAASDEPFNLSLAERRQNFLLFKDANGQSMLTANKVLQQLMDDLAESHVVELRDGILQNKELRVITDDNMLTEYKR